MEINKIYCMDAKELLKEFPDSKRIVVITDPPYGIDYNPNWKKGNGSESDFNKIEGDNEPFNPEHLLRFENVIIFGSNYFSNKLPVGNWIIWDKRLSEKKDNMIGNPLEMAWYKSNKTSGEKIYRVLHGGVINADSIYGNNKKRLHPTQKPVKLFRMIIKDFTNENDLIIDPYCGSGTTAVACKQLNRNFICCDIKEEYVKIANQRLSQESLHLFQNSKCEGLQSD